MKKLLLSLLTVSLILTSCGGTSPVKFNDTIVKANETISHVSDSYTETLSAAIASGSYESIAAATDSALVKIDAELDIVKALEAPKGAEEFKNAALKTYQDLRAIVEAGRKYTTLTEESSDEEFDKISDEYDAKMDAYNASFEQLANTQKAYAKEAGYDLK